MPAPSEFLNAAYEALGYRQGSLLSVDTPRSALSEEEWLEVGDWLALAEQAGARSLFFVDGNPVIVFAEGPDDEEALRRVFNRVWCMARPVILLLSTPASLAAYHLSRPPVPAGQWAGVEPLAVVERITEMAEKMHAFRREFVESGVVFEDQRFQKYKDRADEALIRDLAVVRRRLIDLGLGGKNLPVAHALIGRSIFIRYLEDRGILQRSYFENVASGRPEWKRLLERPLEKPPYNPDHNHICYPKVLGNIDFAYALFDQLAKDFNGDIFPALAGEDKQVEPQHLRELRDLFLGDTGPQHSLFFWAYEFDVIPIELISSIYEEFYHSTRDDDKGTHYTPSSLVDFTLERVLSGERLRTAPRVIDPACGSGIFLVEAFRRIVRYERYREGGGRLDAEALYRILRNQIAGIEINPEAARVTAFSLYLAVLNHLDPPDILHQIKDGRQLPHFIYDPSQEPAEDRFDIILCANAFEADSSPYLQERFGTGSADVVVGNPPWGNIQRANTEGREALTRALSWCERRNLPVGDKEWSQIFVWRSLDLLRSGGSAALLVSTGIFFNHLGDTKLFRKLWLRQVVLHEVVNFAHVRRLFFAVGTGPFASVVFTKCSDPAAIEEHRVQYWSARRTARVASTQAVVLSRTELNVVPQRELIRNDRLWKVYWWGNHRDANLIASLDANRPLRDYVDRYGQGFKEAKQDRRPSGDLKDFPYLPIERFRSYGPLDPAALSWSVPDRVQHQGKLELYEGERLLVKRGQSPFETRLQVRIATEKFCFRHSLQAYRLRDPEPWHYEVLLGILWSSLAQYYLFMTSSAWGIWHDEVRVNDFLRLPVRFPDERGLRERIQSIVRELRALTSKPVLPLFPDELDFGGREVGRLESELDDAIFELYGCTEADRAQVLDLHSIGLEYLHAGRRAAAATPVVPLPVKTGCRSDLPPTHARAGTTADYLDIFLRIWNRELRDKELTYTLIAPSGHWPLMAVIFSAVPAVAASAEQRGLSDVPAWSDVLLRLSKVLTIKMDSDRVYIDGFARVITDNEIIIIKRNERRLWTRSAAFEDAEAIMVQVMELRSASRG